MSRRHRPNRTLMAIWLLLFACYFASAVVGYFALCSPGFSWFAFSLVVTLLDVDARCIPIVLNDIMTCAQLFDYSVDDRR